MYNRGALSRFEKIEVSCLGVNVHHATLIPEGLNEFACGVGTNESEGIDAAIRSWMFTDFPVYFTYMSPTKVDLNVTSITIPGDGDGHVGWTILMSPLYTIGYSTELGKDSLMEMYDVISNVVRPMMPRYEKLFSMKMIISYDYGGTARALCRIDGQSWPAGQKPLLKFARKVSNEQSKHYREQFLLFVPDKPSETGATLESNQRDDKQTAQAWPVARSLRRWWFQFWKG